MEQEHLVLKEEDYLNVVTFFLAKEEFGFEISNVREIIRLGEITRVPKCPHYIVGVTNLRGTVIPIVNLRQCFSMETAPYRRSTRVVVVNVEDLQIGFIVDSVTETKQFPIKSIDSPPQMIVGQKESEYIVGVAKLEDRLISLLDLNKIFSRLMSEVENQEKGT